MFVEVKHPSSSSCWSHCQRSVLGIRPFDTCDTCDTCRLVRSAVRSPRLVGLCMVLSCQAGEDYQVRNVAQRNVWGQSPAELASSAPEWLQRHLRPYCNLSFLSMSIKLQLVVPYCAKILKSSQSLSMRNMSGSKRGRNWSTSKSARINLWLKGSVGANDAARRLDPKNFEVWSDICIIPGQVRCRGACNLLWFALG